MLEGTKSFIATIKCGIPKNVNLYIFHGCMTSSSPWYSLFIMWSACLRKNVSYNNLIFLLYPSHFPSFSWCTQLVWNTSICNVPCLSTWELNLSMVHLANRSRHPKFIFLMPQPPIISIFSCHWPPRWSCSRDASSYSRWVPYSLPN